MTSKKINNIENGSATKKIELPIVEALDNHIRAIKFQALTETELLHHWACTTAHRLKQIKVCRSTGDFIEEWSQYRDSNGFKLVI